MATQITKKKINGTKDLAEAIRIFFNLNLEERLCILTDESMEGDSATAYNQLGLNARRETYKKIASDFKIRADYKENNGKRNIILDVGCGSGLLSLKLAEQTSGIIIGVDTSKDMIFLARQNKKRRAEEISDLVQYNPWFIEGSVYDLPVLVEPVDYIVCRNVLHRLRKPEKAIEQMLKVLKVEGKMYLRDLKRDADWRTIVERIGKERWANPTLVKDYIAAMASTLTIGEIKEILRDKGIQNYIISNGSYKNGNEPLSKDNLREFEKETEYVCVIEKPKPKYKP